MNYKRELSVWHTCGVDGEQVLVRALHQVVVQLPVAAAVGVRCRHRGDAAVALARVGDLRVVERRAERGGVVVHVGDVDRDGRRRTPRRRPAVSCDHLQLI